ncbi:MAG: prephenate dehydrogenase/arogenate dehydrogenase family protein [Mariprofundaceae bacterium]|nr:prephenate dehydrogenase/arogenate dehydrogenase family protein [Mariprofundaceae bacterium]
MIKNTPRPINHLVIIGVGLIGGSFSLAIQRNTQIERITGVGRNQKNLECARKRGIIQYCSQDARKAVCDADVVFIAAPVASYADILAQISDVLPASAIVTDAGSTKQSVINDAHKQLKNIEYFVPAHPLAGTEQSGAGAAFADLFEDRWCILTPEENITDPVACQTVSDWWRACGANVMAMHPSEHDDLLAAVSHLPHLAAYAVVNTVSKLKKGTHDPFQFAAGGFRDFTRIASSSPTMWRDIALCNRDALLHKLDALKKELDTMHQALKERDGDSLLVQFEAARLARETWLKAYQSEHN